MPTDDQQTRPQVEKRSQDRLPYEPPRLEVLELRPEEQLLACTRVSQHHCGSGFRKLS